MGGRGAVLKARPKAPTLSRQRPANHQPKHCRTSTIQRPGTVAVPTSATVTACWPAVAAAPAPAPAPAPAAAAAAAAAPRPAASWKVCHRTRGYSCARASCSWTRGEASRRLTAPYKTVQTLTALSSPAQPHAALTAPATPCGPLRPPCRPLTALPHSPLTAPHPHSQPLAAPQSLITPPYRRARLRQGGRRACVARPLRRARGQRRRGRVRRSDTRAADAYPRDGDRAAQRQVCPLPFSPHTPLHNLIHSKPL